MTMPGVWLVRGRRRFPSGVDDHVKSIARTYDNLGRPINITSYANADGTGTVRNQVRYQYYWIDRVHRIYQSHENAVNTSTSPRVEFLNYDTSNSGNVYTDGLHRLNAYYPVASGARLEMWYGSDNSLTDRLHRTVYEKLWGGSALNGNQAHTSIYQYNGTKRVVGVWSENSFGTDADRRMYSASGNYDSLDRFGRVVKFAWKDRSSGAVLDQVDYAYDDAGNRLTRDVRVDLVNGTYPDTRDQKYTYDGLDRLLTYDQGIWNGSAITSSNRQRYWELDQLGNWSQLRDGLDASGTLLENRLTLIDNAISGWTVGPFATPAYDAAGNMTTMPQPYDTTQTFNTKYDAWNRLVSLATFGITPVTVQVNEYDGLGQRIRKDLPGTADDRDYYYNDQWQLLTEVKDSAVEAIYHWHPFYIDALAVRMRASDTHFFLQDANFDVTAAVSDSTNAVVERYCYSPYGEVTVLDANFTPDSVNDDGVSDIGNNHLYTGRERDPETGLQLNRNRYYHPLLGRWVNRDPIGYEGGGYNLYAYVGGMPTRFVDPTGEIIPIVVVGGVIGGYFLWPDPVNAPAPGDPIYPDTDAGLPGGVVVGGIAGAGGAAGGRIICKICSGRGEGPGPLQDPPAATTGPTPGTPGGAPGAKPQGRKPSFEQLEPKCPEGLDLWGPGAPRPF